MKKVFASCGDNVTFQIRVIPLYPELIKIGSNIVIGTGVKLVTHDAIHKVYNRLPGIPEKMPEMAQCIEIKDNVFIGVNCTVLGNVRIGPNVIVSANSLVNKDLEPGGVYGGVPARKIGDIDEFWRKRKNQKYQGISKKQMPTAEEVKAAWESFYGSRDSGSISE